jgi:DNA modification methylase
MRTCLSFGEPGYHTYNPKLTVGRPYIVKEHSMPTCYDVKSKLTATVNTGTRYPKSILTFSSDTGRESLHPSRKLVKLFEYMIRTHEGEIVLDNCMGSGTTAVARINTNRHHIGFENDAAYYAAALQRIEKHSAPKVKAA